MWLFFSSWLHELEHWFFFHSDWDLHHILSWFLFLWFEFNWTTGLRKSPEVMGLLVLHSKSYVFFLYLFNLYLFLSSLIQLNRQFQNLQTNLKNLSLTFFFSTTPVLSEINSTECLFSIVCPWYHCQISTGSKHMHSFLAFLFCSICQYIKITWTLMASPSQLQWKTILIFFSTHSYYPSLL
jgi:hypothetical protein